MTTNRPRGRPAKSPGDRVVQHDGYVALYLTPAEQAWLRTRRKFTLEHRVVMARALGRPLRPGEEVRHKNGVKGDNRIENLELCSGVQSHRAVRDRAAAALAELPLGEVRAALDRLPAAALGRIHLAVAAAVAARLHGETA